MKLLTSSMISGSVVRGGGAYDASWRAMIDPPQPDFCTAVGSVGTLD